MNYEKFNEYMRLNTVNDLITDPSLTNYVLGRDTASEALEYLKSLRRLNSFELKVHEESIDLAIQEIDNFKVSILNAIKQKKKNDDDKYNKNKREAEKAKNHFDENIKPTVEALIDEMYTLAKIKGWQGTQIPSTLKSILVGIEKGVDEGLNDPMSLDWK